MPRFEHDVEVGVAEGRGDLFLTHAGGGAGAERKLRSLFNRVVRRTSMRTEEENVRARPPGVVSRVRTSRDFLAIW